MTRTLNQREKKVVKILYRIALITLIMMIGILVWEGFYFFHPDRLYLDRVKILFILMFINLFSWGPALWIEAGMIQIKYTDKNE